MPETPLRMGLLGAARIAPAALLKPARRTPEVRVMAVAARDPARARAFARRYEIPQVHDSYAALIADPAVDAIYNPLPNHLHFEWTVRALRAGKHVLCEKPMAANASEAAQLAQVAQETGRVLMEAFHYRYHPLALRVKEIVDSGELGALRHLETYFCTTLWRRSDIRYRYDLAGGATMDLGCYAIHQLRYLADAEPVVLRATATIGAPQIDRRMEALFRFPSGCTARMTVSFLSTSLLRIQTIVQGEQGELRVLNPFLPHLFHRLTVRSPKGKRNERCKGETSYTYQLRAFSKAVRGEAPAPTNALDAIANLRVIDAVYEKAGLKRRGDG